MCLCVFSRNCQLTTPDYLRGRMAAKPATKCAWLQLCRKVKSFIQSRDNIIIIIISYYSLLVMHWLFFELYSCNLLWRL